MEFLPYPFKDWNTQLILLNIEILTLSSSILEFLPYPFKLWNSYLILSNFEILTLSF